ncbi:MAG TPA: 16S rRNA (guanine(966)-N(2))-methyltransferase RsmD [Rhodanobacteraceae bacterium]|nr:16S rRNA (guanine(966)-N(2))-methyltransferase RsmD [Rhodanobacteraceae bacterium]
MTPPGRIRIIGGRLRGSRLAVPESAGLRPTPDRVRETLFNWLREVIDGARCLDLFAGSGAVGIEALSRGAAAVQFVEREAPIAGILRANLERLKVEGGSVACADALDYLRSPPQPFDLVFLDPPFALDLAPPCAEALERGGWLAPRAMIYVEQPAQRLPRLPPNWRPMRQGVAGALSYTLLQREAAPNQLD